MKIKSILTIVTILATCFNAFAESAFTPSPKDLLSRPEYLVQVLQIDEERVSQNLPKLSTMILLNLVSREDNGTDPVVIEIERIRPREGEILFDEDGEVFIDPLHDKVEVVEYFILDVPENLLEDIESLEVNDEQIVAELLEEQEEIPLVDGLEVDNVESIEEEDGPEKIEETDEPSLQDQNSIEGMLAPSRQNSEKQPYVNLAAFNADSYDYQAILTSAHQSPEMEADWDDRRDGPFFTELTLEALEDFGQNLLDPNLKMNEGGYSRYCKRYNSLSREERKQFWLMFISGLTRMESGFAPEKQYREKFTHNGERVYSRGLLQMSIGSVNQDAYACNVKRAQDLHKPEVNINCAVKIMNFWVKKDRAIYGVRSSNSKKRDWLGVANYWAPIRLEKYQGSKREQHERLGNMINDLDICR